MEENIAQLKQDVISFKDMPYRDAERRPGKPNQGKEGVYMTEARGNFKIGGKAAMKQRSESAITCRLSLLGREGNQVGRGEDVGGKIVPDAVSSLTP